MKKYSLYDLTLVLFVTILMLSNIVAAKLVPVGPLVITAATFMFPLSYIFGDVLVEVYGFKLSRRVIWVGFAANFLMVIVFYLIYLLPTISGQALQDSYKMILLGTPRIVGASLVAYLLGSFVNSVILSRIKVIMAGKKLWIRTISSTIFGEFFDTLVFTILAFIGTVPGYVLITMIYSSYLVKCGVEILFTPITYKIVALYKRIEKVDVYDTKERYNPFGIGVEG